jgi:hypothetical protein
VTHPGTAGGKEFFAGASISSTRDRRHDSTNRLTDRKETTMRYALLICGDENDAAVQGDEDLLKEYGAFGEEMGRRGVLQGGERLRPTTSATTVQVRDGKVLTSDGPFAETKEQIGGFFLVECGDLDEAIDVASQIPGARHGTIEVRPIWEM